MSKKQLWLYGAGIVANQYLDYVDKGVFDSDIAGIIVSSKEDNPDSLRGYPVLALSEFCKQAGEAEQVQILLAVALKKQQEVAELLQTHGYRDLIFWKKEKGRFSWAVAEYRFINRRQNKEKVCFVLGGHKEFLWDDVQERLHRYVPADVEVCLLSAGVYSEKLANTAESYGWSYISTAFNSITLIQNLAMELYPEANYIYKMDEDIFVTEGCFERTWDAFHRAEEEDFYHVGVAAPLINVNAYGFIPILKAQRRIETYEQKFEHPVYGGDVKKKIESDPDAAAFMWGLTGELPLLDELNRQQQGRGSYSLCGVRFSIGFILYSREFWDDMGELPVSGDLDLGTDEESIMAACGRLSYGFAVAEDTVVGHFSFGKQTEGMKKYYENNREYFK